MRKKILLMLSAFCFMGATVFGQAIEGGAGIIHVDGNPNENVLLNVVTENEGNMAYDATNQVAYFYNPAGTAAIGPFPGGTAGTRWVPVDITGLVDPITNILTPEDELSVSITNGVATITFESDATIAYVPGTNTLTFTDVDGQDTDVDLSGLNTPVSAADPSITVTNVGTATNPDYEVGVTGAAVVGNAGMVPVTDGAGNLDWTTVVEDVTVNSNGQIEITYTNNATPVILDMGSIPEVANITELNAAAAALGSGTSGLARAADNNTFGMPATSSVGVLFFISN